jgi:hypothetical protein
MLHSYPFYPCFDYLQIYLEERNLQRSSVRTCLPSLLGWSSVLSNLFGDTSSVFPPLASETNFQSFVKLFFITIINHNNYFLCLWLCEDSVMSSSCCSFIIQTEPEKMKFSTLSDIMHSRYLHLVCSLDTTLLAT